MDALLGGQSQETRVRTVMSLMYKAGKALICRRPKGRAARETHLKLKDIERQRERRTSSPRLFDSTTEERSRVEAGSEKGVRKGRHRRALCPIELSRKGSAIISSLPSTIHLPSSMRIRYVQCKDVLSRTPRINRVIYDGSF